MNLIDLITRQDRSLNSMLVNIKSTTAVRNGLKMNAVLLPAGSKIRIGRANEFECLNDFPVSIGWKCSLHKKGNTCSLKIVAVNDEEHFVSTLFDSTVADIGRWSEVLLDWPPLIGRLKEYSLIIECCRSQNSRWRKYIFDEGTAVIGVSTVFSSRKFVPQLIRGFGVEVGPGARPHIHPSNEVDVRYVESRTAQEWVKLYRKADINELSPESLPWERYIVSDAAVLQGFDNGTLDFIFSNHVFEHLMNPLGVLENWSKKLKPCGLVYAVIPNARSCFDLRQPLSTESEWLEENQNARWSPQRKQYEKWCAFTAPYNTPEDLIERAYSIHVHYYSPYSASQLAALAVREGLYNGYYIAQTANHKDFALILYKGPTIDGVDHGIAR